MWIEGKIKKGCQEREKRREEFIVERAEVDDDSLPIVAGQILKLGYSAAGFLSSRKFLNTALLIRLLQSKVLPFASTNRLLRSSTDIKSLFISNLYFRCVTLSVTSTLQLQFICDQGSRSRVLI